MATWSKVLTKSDDIHVFQYSARQYVYGSHTSPSLANKQRWSYPSSFYGLGYYNWNSNSTTDNNTGITSWSQRSNPIFAVPFNGKLVNHQFIFSAGASETYRYELKEGTPIYASGVGTSLSSVGTGMTQNATALRTYRFDEDLDVSVSEGDILIPTFSKTTNLSSTTTRYLYGTWIVQIKKD